MTRPKVADFNPPPLGVGMVYFPALEGLFKQCNALLDVIEVEPQTLWFRGYGNESHRLDERAFDQLAHLPQRKLVHGVGLPLASSIKFDPQQIPPWQQSIARLNPLWVSEHLAFMRVPSDTPESTSQHSGFLLPPLQCQETVDIAVARISELRRLSGVPVAFEISPNYLRPQRGEMLDGDFFARVAASADCGIVLDLHNLWCNERNGRQRMQEVIESLPLNRVWEIHLAGGDNHQGYWLDAHSDLVPPLLIELCEQLLPKLPNLGAMVFEIMPDYVQAKELSLDQLVGQIEIMKSLWSLRPTPSFLHAQSSLNPTTITLMPTIGVKPVADLKVVQWERSLGALVNGRDLSISGVHYASLSKDPAVSVYKSLIESFRSGTLAEGLTLSYRLLVLTLGEKATLSLMEEFWASCWPEPFAFDEMLGFVTFLRQRISEEQLAVAFLDNVLNYEIANAQAQQTGKDLFVTFDCEPIALLEALSQGKLPAMNTHGQFEVRVPG